LRRTDCLACLSGACLHGRKSDWQPTLFAIFSFYAVPVCESIAVRNDKVIRSQNPKTKRAHVLRFFCFSCLFCHTYPRAYLTTWLRACEVWRAVERLHGQISLRQRARPRVQGSAGSRCLGVGADQGSPGRGEVRRAIGAGDWQDDGLRCLLPCGASAWRETERRSEEGRASMPVNSRWRNAPYAGLTEDPVAWVEDLS
jgi:hypothetical protein